MSPREIEQAVKRCDRRRRWPWIVLCAVVVAMVIVGTRPISIFPERGLKSDALVTALAVINAVKQFQMENDCLPAPTSAVQGHDGDSDTGASEGLILILKGEFQQAHSKSKDFLGELKEARHVGSRILHGLWRSEDGIALYDPWGGLYLVRLDGDGDGFVADPEHGGRLAQMVIIWSAGRDGDPNTWKDNVKSWGP